MRYIFVSIYWVVFPLESLEPYTSCFLFFFFFLSNSVVHTLEFSEAQVKLPPDMQDAIQDGSLGANDTILMQVCNSPRVLTTVSIPLTNSACVLTTPLRLLQEKILLTLKSVIP